MKKRIRKKKAKKKNAKLNYQRWDANISQKTVYVIEEKFNKDEEDDYKTMVEKDRIEIGEKKYKKIMERINEGWVLYDSLSYSEDYFEIKNEYRRIVKDKNCKRFRIVKAKCIIHKEYGISLNDLDYHIMEHAKEKTGLIVRIRNFFSVVMQRKMVA